MDRECRRRYEGREFISFSHMLAFRMNWASGVVMMRGRKGHRYDINELLVAADLAGLSWQIVGGCCTQKASTGIGKNRIPLELGCSSCFGVPVCHLGSKPRQLRRYGSLSKNISGYTDPRWATNLISVRTRKRSGIHSSCFDN